VTNEASSSTLSSSEWPGGYAAALYGASAGLNIAIVERDKVGGTCLHVAAFRQGVPRDRARSSHRRTLGRVRHHNQGYVVDSR